MKKSHILRWIAAVLILFSLASFGWEYYNRTKAERKYKELAEQIVTESVSPAETEEAATESVETQAADSSSIDFESLRKTNPEVAAWIQVPGTNINYPVLHDPGDNEKYLHLDWEGKESVSGAIYLDSDDRPDFTSLHNIIYGHHMRDGSMFKDVMKFREKEFMNNHQKIILYLPDREVELRPFACLYTKPEGIRRKTQFSNEESFQKYINDMVSGAEVYSEPEQKITKLYSLITCSYEFDDARTILYCYEVENSAGPEAESAARQSE